MNKAIDLSLKTKQTLSLPGNDSVLYSLQNLSLSDSFKYFEYDANLSGTNAENIICFGYNTSNVYPETNVRKSATGHWLDINTYLGTKIYYYEWMNGSTVTSNEYSVSFDSTTRIGFAVSLNGVKAYSNNKMIHFWDLGSKDPLALKDQKLYMTIEGFNINSTANLYFDPSLWITNIDNHPKLDYNLALISNKNLKQY
jgi:hypothetical protein